MFQSNVLLNRNDSVHTSMCRKAHTDVENKYFRSKRHLDTVLIANFIRCLSYPYCSVQIMHFAFTVISSFVSVYQIYDNLSFYAFSKKASYAII